MKTMNKIAALLCLAFLATQTSAASWSLVERGYIKKIPAAYTKHTAGIIAVPTDDDVKRALEFGAASKEKREPLEYAYIVKSQESAFNNDSIYVTVTTPLALIATHARDQAKEYRMVDEEFVKYARALGAVSVSISQQFMTANFRAVAFNWEIILLRDGGRVETLNSLAPWKGGNPFVTSKPLVAQYNATLAAIQQTAAQQLRTTAASMDDNGKRLMVHQLAGTGWSDSQICSALGWSAADLARIKGEIVESTAGASLITLSDRDAIFSIQELKKTGRYELVFRRLQTGMLGNVKEKEVRVPISFEKFR